MPKQNKVILALDVSSSSTGYAIFRNGRWNKSTASFGLVKIPSKHLLGKRLVIFRDAIAAIIDKVQPDIIIIEDVFSGRNIATMKLLARFNGVAVEVSRRHLKCEPIIALTTKVRSFLECGRKKEDAFKYICTRYNLKWKYSKMNDVTDAICLALYAHGLEEK